MSRGTKIDVQREISKKDLNHCVACKSRSENNASHISPNNEENESWQQDAAFAMN
jgi:hypothetical protein